MEEIEDTPRPTSGLIDQLTSLDSGVWRLFLFIVAGAATAGAAVQEIRISQKDGQIEIVKQQSEEALASIARANPIDEFQTQYLNVSNMVISRNAVSSLDEEDYLNLADGSVFVRPPQSEGWSHSVISERDLLVLTFPDRDDPVIIGSEELTDKNVFLWQGDEIYTWASKAGRTITWRPTAFIQVLNADKLFEDALVYADQRWESPPTLESKNVLDRQYNGNVSAIILNGFIVNQFQYLERDSSIRVSLEDVGKEGNTLYARTLTALPNTSEDGPLQLSSELLVFTFGAKIVLIKVEVPSQDGRSKAHAWISQFLSSARVVEP